MDKVLSGFESSGYDSGNDRRAPPHSNAQRQANHSNISLPNLQCLEVAGSSIPHLEAEYTRPQIARDCTTVQAPATIAATIGGAR
jgi:hypothetical protein